VVSGFTRDVIIVNVIQTRNFMLKRENWVVFVLVVKSVGLQSGYRGNQTGQREELKIMQNVERGMDFLELDKERNVWRDMGKTEDDYAYTFKTKPTARKHFDNILNLLNRLYQESSVLNFAGVIIDNDKLLREYQKRSEKLIKRTVRRIENMFDKKDDPKSLTFVIWQMRNVLYGLAFKATLEKEMGN